MNARANPRFHPGEAPPLDMVPVTINTSAMEPVRQGRRKQQPGIVSVTLWREPQDDGGRSYLRIELDPQDARELGAALLRGADFAEGKETRP